MNIKETNGGYDITHNGMTKQYNYIPESSLNDLVNDLVSTVTGLDDILRDEAIGKSHYYDEYAWECYSDIIKALKHIHNIQVKDVLNYCYEYKDGQYIRHFDDEE